MTKEEFEANLEEWFEECRQKRQLSELVQQRHLLDRISDAPPPLADRIEPREPTYEPPAPLPATFVDNKGKERPLNFHKTKNLKRLQEFEVMLTATHLRLQPVFEKLQLEDQVQRDENVNTYRVAEGDRAKLWKWWQDFQDLIDCWEEWGHKAKPTQWRRLKGALTAIGKVKFHNLNLRLPTIVTELIHANIRIPLREDAVQ